jgi:hypothetical protein
MNILDDITLINIIFLILAIGGILISIYLYNKSKREKIPLYNIKSFNLLDENLTKVKDLGFIYKGKNINSLTLTKFALWNQGKETINSLDVAPTDKIRIEILNGYEILNVEEKYVKKEANNFSFTLSNDKKIININFDYFHFNEGIIISFYHTGKSSEDFSILGTIKGVDGIKKASFDLGFYTQKLGKNLIWKIPRKIRLIFLPIFLIPLIICMLFDTFFHSSNKPDKIFELNDE